MGTLRLETRIVVAGGGPAGMMLGLLLARSGVEVLVLEKRAELPRGLPGGVLHPSTLEVIHSLGLLEGLLAEPHQEESSLAAQVGGRSYPIADFSRLPARCPFAVRMPREEFLGFLASRAAEHPGFTLRMGAEVESLILRDGRVAGLRARGPEGALEVSADLVVGADGPGSAVREMAGLEVRRLDGTPRVDRLERWWRPGLLCIGGAAHAMSEEGGTELDLAVRDAVAASNVLAEPARSGRLSPRHLRRVQRRRRWPSRVVQRAHLIATRRLAAESHDGQAEPPAPVRLLARHPSLRRLSGRLIGWGAGPELPLPLSSERHPPPSLSAAWRLGGLSPLELSRRVWRQVGRDELLDRAASLSFYFMFSLFPMLIFLTALFGLLSAQGLMENLLSYADRVLPGDAASLLRKTIQEISAGAGGGFLSAGLAGSLWVASSGMVSIISALNRAFGIREPRSWFRRRLTAIGLTAGFSVLALLALFLIAFGGPFGERVASFAGLGELFKSAWNVFRWTAGPLAALAGVGLVYRLAPAGRRGRPLPTPGSVFAVLAWIAASQGLSLYVGGSGRYNAVYGSIGAVVVLLLWLYLSALTLLVGAEIDAEIERAASQ